MSPWTTLNYEYIRTGIRFLQLETVNSGCEFSPGEGITSQGIIPGESNRLWPPIYTSMEQNDILPNKFVALTSLLGTYHENIIYLNVINNHMLCIIKAHVFVMIEFSIVILINVQIIRNDR